ncbi:Ring finger [Rhizoctonia solani]|uniref:E3 ubiquitin-protein ligase listerin n=1 Tax=Rhizoctonia solani TaxID=456999 RepID=A0A8H7M5G8_9AGAM|nr:Ring finger [Rhizoctonia solani]
MGKQGKSSATSGTRKKHARKAATHDPSIAIVPAAKSQGKGKGKGKNKEPRVKQYIPPPKYKPLVDDPIESLSVASVLPPNMVLCFKGLSKKDPVTKMKALDDLATMLDDESWNIALPVWLWHFVSLSVHPNRRLRESSAIIHSKLFEQPILRDEAQSYILREPTLKDLQLLRIRSCSDLSVNSSHQIYYSAPYYPLNHQFGASDIDDEKKEPVSWGYEQRAVRMAGWKLIKEFVKYLQNNQTDIVEEISNDDTPLPLKLGYLRNLGCAALRSAWVETDSIRKSQDIVVFPEVWDMDPINQALIGTSQHTAAESDSSEDIEDGPMETVPNGATRSHPATSYSHLAFNDFLHFLELGCRGSATQSYPAIVVVLSTIPEAIFPYEPNTLERLFTSLWAAYDGKALSVLPRDREPAGKAFLSCVLDCPELQPGKAVELVPLKWIARIIQEVIHGDLSQNVPVDTAGQLIGESMKKLEHISPGHMRSAARGGINQEIVDKILKDKVQVKLEGVEGCDSPTEQARVLISLWEHLNSVTAPWLVEVTDQVWNAEVLDRMVRIEEPRGIIIFLNGYLSAPTASENCRRAIWSQFLSACAGASAFSVLRDILDLVGTAALTVDEVPALFDLTKSWMVDLAQGNPTDGATLGSVLVHWTLEILELLLSAFILHARELLFSSSDVVSPVIQPIAHVLDIVLTSDTSLDFYTWPTLNFADAGALALKSWSTYAPVELQSESDARARELIRSLLISCSTSLSARDVLTVAVRSALYLDEKMILLEMIPSQYDFDQNLDDLNDNPSPVLAEYDPLVRLGDREPDSLALATYDSHGLSEYARNPGSDPVAPQNAEEVIHQYYSIATRNSPTSRDLRLLRRIMQFVLRDAETDILDLWSDFAQSAYSHYSEAAGQLGRFFQQEVINQTGLPLLRALNCLAPPPESGIVFMPQQRAVYLVQALQKWMSSDEELDTSMEALVTVLLGHLLPILQTIRGAHWEFILDVLENNLSGNEHYKPLSFIANPEGDNNHSQSDYNKSAAHGNLGPRQHDIFQGILQLFLNSSGDAEDSETRVRYNSYLAEVIQAIPSEQIHPDLFEKLFSLVFSESVPIKLTAHYLARRALSQITEQRVLEAAVNAPSVSLAETDVQAEKSFELPHPLVEKLVSSGSSQANYSNIDLLLAWWLALEFFDKTSLKIKQDYFDQLRRLNLVKTSLLPCLFKLLNLGISGEKPFNLSPWQVDVFYLNLYDNSFTSAENVLAAHIYFKSLKFIPALIRAWYSECQDRQLCASVSAYTRNYFSPTLINQELAHFRASAASASEILVDDTFTVKVAPSVNEISASYAVDEQESFEVAIRLPNEYPLRAAEVKDVRGVAGMENRRRAWLFGVQNMAQQGLIYDGLVMYKKNIAGHFEGKSECAICYS